MVAYPLSHVLPPRVVLVIGCHWAVAISLIFVNKRLLSVQYADQDLTIFIAWAQCLFSVLTVAVGAFVKRYLRPRSSPTFDIPFATFVHTDVLYMTFTFIGILVLNNLLLKNIGVDFYQMARSSTLVFTVIFTRIILGVRVSVNVIFSCTLILIGFMVSVDQEMLLTSLSWTSVFYGLSASMAAALNGIFIKRVDKHMRGNALNLSLVNSINTVVILFPLMLSTGQLRSAIVSPSPSPSSASTALWWQLVVTGVLRLLVGWTTVKVISLTSPVTHHMSINAKSLLQTFIAVFLQDEGKTLAWWVGNFLVVLGILNYGLSKSKRSDLCSAGSNAGVVRSSFVISRNSNVLPV